MRLTIIFLLLAVCAFGQVNKITPTNMRYIEDFIDTSRVTVVYFSGYGQFSSTNSEADLNNLKNTAFYTKFYKANKGRYNFFIPMRTKTSYSWVYPMTGGVPIGVGFIRWMYTTYGINPKKILLTGHSSGSPYSTAAYMPDELGAMAAVSTSSETYQGAVMLGKIKMPLIHWHGKDDRVQTNNYAAGYQACITWYQNTGGGKPTWIPLDGVGHSADLYAYAPTSGLKEWIDKIFPPVIIPPPPVKVKDYLDSAWTFSGDSLVYFKFRSGRILKK